MTRIVSVSDIKRIIKTALLWLVIAPGWAAFGQDANQEIVQETAPLSGSAELGRLVFNRCAACHVTGTGADAVGTQFGPQLNGIVGRRAGSLFTYKYSLALADADFFWTADKLARYIAQPRREVVGTSMAYAGIKDKQDIANLIAYLGQFTDLIDAAPRPRLRPSNL